MPKCEIFLAHNQQVPESQIFLNFLQIEKTSKEKFEKNLFAHLQMNSEVTNNN